MFCEAQETMQIIVPDIAHRLLFKVNVKFRNLNFYFFINIIDLKKVPSPFYQ